MYTETFDQTINDKDAKICLETLDDSGSSKHCDSNPEVIDRSGSSIGSERQINVITRGERDKNNHSDTHINGNESMSSSARRSSSSSSSESSSGDFCQMDSFNFTTSGASTLASKSGKNDVSSESSAKFEVDNSSLVPVSSSQVYDVTHNQIGMTPTVSPPIQVMDRSGGYDPSRIPSAVFERNSTMEWSLTSNESLFSIHLDNNSFSREHAFMFCDLGMSGELTKSGEFNMFSRTPSVIVEEIDAAKKSVEVENLPKTDMPDETFKLEERLSEDQNEMKNSHQAISCKTSNMSSLSHGSGTSGKSFAFPIKEERACPFCYCSNCSWAFCYYKWPSCDCSNCGWAFCYCWNCSYTKWCYHASPILTESERNSSAKTDVPRQQSQQSFKQESEEVTSDSMAQKNSYCCNCFQFNSTTCCCNWLQCFSCPSCKWKPSCTWCNCCC